MNYFAIPTNGNERLKSGEEVPALRLARATVFFPNELFGSWNKHEVRDLVVFDAPWAQYPHALHAEFTPKGKRKRRRRTLSYRPRMVVYEGWGAGPEPEDFLGEPDTSGPLVVRHSRRTTHDDGWDVEMQRRVDEHNAKPVFALFPGTDS